MRTATLLLTIPCLLVLWAAEADARGKRRSAPYTGAWEHRCVEMEWSRATEAEEFANSMGLAGWQLVGFPKPRIFCFKRQQVDQNSGEGRLRMLNDRLMKLTDIYNSGRITEMEYRRRLESIEAERTKVLANPGGF